MAGGATIDLYHRMLENKGAGLFSVALEADGIPRRRSAELARFEAAMRIVAIDALYEAFVDAMVEGTSELLLDLKMAGEAKLRLLLLHKELRFLSVVWVVAIGAADIVLQVRRATEVRVFSTILMAA